MLPSAGYAMVDRDAFSGDNDAQLVLKAAASDEGLYFYCEAVDDAWVQPVSGNDRWQYDAVDLYIDTMTSQEIINCGDLCLVNPTFGWALTFSSQQFQVNMGANGVLPEGFNFQYYDAIFWDWVNNNVSFANVGILYSGMFMKVWEVSATQKAQEWYLPWKWVGNRGLNLDVPVGTIAEDRQFAFAGGYNDLDGDAAAVNCLRWQGTPAVSDPYAGVAAATWGNFQVTEQLTTKNLNRLNTRVAKDAKVAKTEYFTLKGQRLEGSAANLLKEHSTLLKRVYFADNTFAVSKINR
jgi:hypothetical protein